MNNNYNEFKKIWLNKITEENIDYLLATLPKREEEIIRMYYGLKAEKKKMSEIAKIYSLSTTRIQQIIQKAMRRLTSSFRLSCVFFNKVEDVQILKFIFHVYNRAKPKRKVLIDQLNIDSRIINSLIRNKIFTIKDLLEKDYDHLVNLKGLGKKSILTITKELFKLIFGEI